MLESRCELGFGTVSKLLSCARVVWGELKRVRWLGIETVSSKMGSAGFA